MVTRDGYREIKSNTWTFSNSLFDLMKPLFLISSLVVVASLIANESFSQTFISKLPADGIGAIYEGRFFDPAKDSKTKPTRSVLTLRCVGTQKYDDGIFRWIEMQPQYYEYIGSKNLQKGISVTKFLVNEKNLTKANGLQANVNSIWTVNTRFPATAEASKKSYHWMLDFYQPAFKKSESVEAKIIKVMGRELKCTGTTFTVKIEEDKSELGPKGTVRKYTVYSNEETPFGCVEMRIDLTSPKGEKRVRLIKLKSVLMNAKPFIKETR